MPGHDLEAQLRLEADERVRLAAETERALVVVTDRRLIVKEAERYALDLPIEDIRRIELSVERGRPATLMVVPRSSQHDPQVLSVSRDQLEAVSRMVHIVGDRLALLD
jgi:hypothetical protein